MSRKSLVYSGNYEWYTPTKYVELVKDVYGGTITLDPASSVIANEIVKAEVFYTEEDNGIEQPWFGKVFCNPPYSMPFVKLFAEKISDSFTNEEIDEGILLTHNSTDTSWYHYAANKASAICFTRKRISFVGADGKVGNAPPRGQSFMYFGNNVDKFYDVFSSIGLIVIPKGN